LEIINDLVVNFNIVLPSPIASPKDVLFVCIRMKTVCNPGEYGACNMKHRNADVMIFSVTLNTTITNFFNFSEIS
jgi:hypothetical protein